MTFHEVKSILNSYGKPVAKVHYESSIKDQYKDTLRTPFIENKQYSLYQDGSNWLMQPKTSIDSCLEESDILGKGIMLPLTMAKSSLKVIDEKI